MEHQHFLGVSGLSARKAPTKSVSVPPSGGKPRTKKEWTKKRIKKVADQLYHWAVNLTEAEHIALNYKFFPEDLEEEAARLMLLQKFRTAA